MKFTIIYHIVTDIKDGQMTTCSLIDLLKYEICNRIWLKASYVADLIKLCKQLLATYNVSSVFVVFSMLNLGSMPISDLLS